MVVEHERKNHAINDRCLSWNDRRGQDTDKARGALIKLVVDNEGTALTSAVESESYQLSSIDTYNMIKPLIEHEADSKLCDIEAEN